MAGVCQRCGGVVRSLQACPVCVAKVCSECIGEYGCEICHGQAAMELPEEMDESSNL